MALVREIGDRKNAFIRRKKRRVAGRGDMSSDTKSRTRTVGLGRQKRVFENNTYGNRWRRFAEVDRGKQGMNEDK